MSNIYVRAHGLCGYGVYVAHHAGGWGPETSSEKSPGDFRRHGMTQSGEYFEIDGSFLDRGEEFKLVVPVRDAYAAYAIYAARVNAGVHVGMRMDFDAATDCLWLLAHSHPVVREGEWDQNNIYR